MEKPTICENTTVYDYTAHCRFNKLMVGATLWVLYAVSMLLGIAMAVLYVFMQSPVVLIFGVVIIVAINLMKFYFQPKSIKKTYQQIYAVRGEMVFVYRFHEDGFDQLCRSKRGESGLEIDYEFLKKIIETPTDILFVTKQNSAYYVLKDAEYAYETEQLSKCISKYKQYRYVGKRPSADSTEPTENN